MPIFQTCGGCLQRAECIRFHACMKRVTREDLGAAEKATVDKMNALISEHSFGKLGSTAKDQATEAFKRALDGPQAFQHDEALLEQLCQEVHDKLGETPDWCDDLAKDIAKTYALQMLRRFGG